jgi:hypothetical protein
VALSLVVHAQPAGAVTAIVFVEPAGPSDATVGEIVYVHGAPACVTVIVCPAIVIVPVRLLVSALAATLYDTLPFPVPLAPAVIVIHGALLAAVHAHDPAFAVTATVPAPPAAVGELAVGEIVVLHTTAACVMPNDWPATVIVAVRGVVLGLAVML